MRHVLMGIMGVLLLGGAARAQSSSEPQVWQGEAFITGFTTGAAMSACTAQGTVSVGDYFLTIYRPIIPGSPNNPSTSDEGLSFFGGRNGLHYYTADGVSFSKPGNSYLEYLSTHAQSSGITTGSASVPFNLKITPAAITLTTPTIGIKGSIDDWENTSGCDVTFTASLVERVD